MRRGFTLGLAGFALACGPDHATVGGEAPAASSEAPTSNAEQWIAEPSQEVELVGEHPPPGEYLKPKSWPEELPLGPHLDPSYAQVTESKAGDIVLEGSLEADAVKPVANAWRAAMEKLGWTEVEPCTSEDTVTCLYRGHGRLASLGVSPRPWSEGYLGLVVHLLPKDHEPITDLPGKCVRPPQRKREFTIHSSGINQEGESFGGSAQRRVSTFATFDLDGDGQSEMAVPHQRGGDCPWDVPRDIYVMRGECGHFVGTITGPPDGETQTADFVKGLRVVHTSAEWAEHGRKDPVPIHHTLTRRYEFDGRKLVKKGEQDQGGRCHHCATSSCTE